MKDNQTTARGDAICSRPRTPSGLQTPSLSFIIPCLNEEKHIRGVMDSIKDHVPKSFPYEVIVVDNGSVDETIERARAGGARVIPLYRGTVGALRNAGAADAENDFLIFLDADVYLTEQWGARIGRILEQLPDDRWIITGSTCGISANPRLIERCWWGQVPPKKKFNYINSGHLIVRRTIFEKLGGFNEKLTTGEDAEFCQRPRDTQVLIRHDDQLAVIHEGYPKNLRSFFRRERWHGVGDYQSLSLFLRSKPALLSLFQAFAFLGLAILSLITENGIFLVTYCLMIAALCTALAFRRTAKINTCLMVNSFLFFIYFWARTLSALDSLTRVNSRQHR